MQARESDQSQVIVCVCLCQLPDTRMSRLRSVSSSRRLNGVGTMGDHAFTPQAHGKKELEVLEVLESKYRVENEERQEELRKWKQSPHLLLPTSVLFRAVFMFIVATITLSSPLQTWKGDATGVSEHCVHDCI